MHGEHKLDEFLKNPEPQDKHTVLFVQKVHPTKGTEHVWHLDVEFKKYIDLHYKHTELEEQIEHPYIVSEHNVHWGDDVW